MEGSFGILLTKQTPDIKKKLSYLDQIFGCFLDALNPFW